MDRTAENRAALEAYAKAWQSGDIAGLFAAYADDIVLHYFGESDLAGLHTGKDAAFTALAEIVRRTNRTLVEIVDVMAGPKRGAIIAREEMEKNGEAHEIERVLVYRLAGGKIAECWVYDRDQRLVDALLS
ncbi:MAG: nuclear transport factor 2 family protein [Alphaproteobacteria bacterium]|nr:nuclear transport factor 2 family protein [Alphaproteobacteria bacterium]